VSTKLFGDAVKKMTKKRRMRFLERLSRLDLLSPRLVAVHMTQVLPAEIDALAAAGVHVVHCPQSNLKLASGVAPICEYQAAGINVAIGTDGAASNNVLDVLAEMRLAALLAKSVAADAAAIPAPEALRMATLLGFVVSGLSFLYAAYAIWARLWAGITVSGWTSLMVAVLFLGGVQLSCLGIIGEYLGRVYEEVKARRSTSPTASNRDRFDLGSTIPASFGA